MFDVETNQSEPDVWIRVGCVPYAANTNATDTVKKTTQINKTIHFMLVCVVDRGCVTLFLFQHCVDIC